MNNKPIPIVSVVIPMFNVERYIAQCIDSVMAQTFKQFEVICVDDGCTDSTLKILEQYNDPRIRLVQQKNRGLSGARNTGIKAAQGIYVAMLDADDFWTVDKLAKHVNHLNCSPKVGVSYCPSWLVDDDGISLGIGQFPKLQHINSRHVFCRNPVGNGSAAVIRRSLLLDLKISGPDDDHFMVFDENLRQSEDIDLWTRIALHGQWQFEGLSTPMTYYRVNAGGLSANLKKQFASWQTAMKKNWALNPTFFKRCYSLAKAYQLRYLSRRAIQSGNRIMALLLIHQAILCNLKIVIEEPKRTLATYCCAWLALLPFGLYGYIEAFAMSVVAKQQQKKNLWPQTSNQVL